MPTLRICYLTPELAPYAKVGGLADVSAALPTALRRAGHDVRVFVPLYAQVLQVGHALSAVEGLQQIPVSLGDRRFTFDVLVPASEGAPERNYFLRCAPLYERAGVYTSDPDEHLRFLLLCRGAIECCRGLAWAPDVFHCHDWQTALVPLLLRTVYGSDRLFERSATVLTIHNLAYQGIFPADIVPQLGLGVGVTLLHQEDLRARRVNFLRTGLMHAGTLTTVSPTYAREIQTAEYGAGLNGLLRRRGDELVGILNGVDTEEWSPATDPFIPVRYSVDSLEHKARNRDALLDRLGSSAAPDIPVVGVVSRLTVQKGFDLVFDPLREQLAADRLRLVALGSGEARYEEAFRGLESAFPGRAVFRRGFDNEVAHLIEAGSDIFLMPSLYEPCGLNQMYSLLYGTVPIVRRTGGLADSVQQFDPRTGEGTGIVFDHYTRDGVRRAIARALELFEDREAWRRMMKNGMRMDFSWESRVPRYVEVYERLVGARSGAPA
ncbi:MAG: glycogen synthase [Gemmatimonadota bacterium]